MLSLFGKSPLTLSSFGWGSIGLVILVTVVPFGLLSLFAYRFIRAAIERATRS